MNERKAPGEVMFGAHSNYFYARNVNERQRLENQFHLFREDFDLWLDEALRLGGLSTDPVDADWSALDLGCGEGQFARWIAQRYSGVRVTGMDVDAAAIDTAARDSRSVPNVQFVVHDARDAVPLPAGGGAGFDVAIMWHVLLYLPDRGKALANLASAIRPGGVLLMCNAPDAPTRSSHPVVTELMAAATEMAYRFRALGLEGSLGASLEESGFVDVTSVVLRYPVGGATACGQRWWAQLLASIAGMRSAVVDAGGLMDGAEFDRKIELLAGESMLRHSGEWSFLLTLARRSGG